MGNRVLKIALTLFNIIISIFDGRMSTILWYCYLTYVIYYDLITPLRRHSS